MNTSPIFIALALTIAAFAQTSPETIRLQAEAKQARAEANLAQSELAALRAKTAASNAPASGKKDAEQAAALAAAGLVKARADLAEAKAELVALSTPPPAPYAAASTPSRSDIENARHQLRQIIDMSFKDDRNYWLEIGARTTAVRERLRGGYSLSQPLQENELAGARAELRSLESVEALEDVASVRAAAANLLSAQPIDWRRLALPAAVNTRGGGWRNSVRDGVKNGIKLGRRWPL